MKKVIAPQLPLLLPGAWMVGFLLLGASPLKAATRTVSSLNDTGPGSLREAIAASAAGDTIQVAVGGTIKLTSGELMIGRDLTLIGSGAALTVSGADVGRVFSIPGNDVVVNLSDLVIIGGNGTGQGGAIYSAGTLVVRNCSFAFNRIRGGSGAAIFNSGKLEIHSSVFWGNEAYESNTDGGAIFNNGGTLTINNSTFASNAAGRRGGGLASTGTLRINHCTFSGNTSYRSEGGAIKIYSGPATIFNTIIADNSSGSANSPDVSGHLSSYGGQVVAGAQTARTQVFAPHEATPRRRGR